MPQVFGTGVRRRLEQPSPGPNSEPLPRDHAHNSTLDRLGFNPSKSS